MGELILNLASSTERAFFSFAPKQVRMFPVIYCFLIFQASANISNNLIVSRLSGKTFGEGDSDSLKVYVGRGTIASGYTPMENVVVRVQAHAKDGNIFGRLPLTQRRWREYLRHTTNPPQMNSKGQECFLEIINPPPILSTFDEWILAFYFTTRLSEGFLACWFFTFVYD